MSLPIMGPKDPDPDYIFRIGDSVSSVRFACLENSEVLVTGTQKGVVEIWSLKSKRAIVKHRSSAHGILYADLVRVKETDYLVSHMRSGEVSFHAVNGDQLTLKKVISVCNIGFNPVCFLKQDDFYWLAFSCDHSATTVNKLVFDEDPPVYKCCTKEKVGMVMKSVLALLKQRLLLICGYENGSVALYDVKKMQLKEQICLYEEPVMNLCCDGERLVVVSAVEDIICCKIDQDLKFHKHATHKSTSRGFSAVCVRTDSKIVVCGAWDGLIRVFGWKKLKPLALLKFHRESVNALAFSDGHVIAAASKDGRVSLWNVYNAT